MNIKDISTKELEQELEKREKYEKAKIKEQQMNAEMEKYKLREPCMLLGRAYGFGHEVNNHVLVTVGIKGNMSWEYKASINCVDTVECYLHNVLGYKITHGLEQKLKQIADGIIGEANNNAKAIAQLIVLSKSHIPDKYDKFKEECEKEYRLAIKERLSEFGKEQLEDVLKDNNSRLIVEVVKEVLNDSERVI